MVERPLDAAGARHGARPLRRRRHLRLGHALLPPRPHRRLRRDLAAGARPRDRRRGRGGRRGRDRPRAGDAGRGQPVPRRCGHCPRCAEGRANLCENIFFMGSASKTPHMQGGFAALFDTTPGQCVPVPDHVLARGRGAGRAAGGLPARGRARRGRRAQRRGHRRRADRPADHAGRPAGRRRGSRRRRRRRRPRSPSRPPRRRRRGRYLGRPRGPAASCRRRTSSSRSPAPPPGLGSAIARGAARRHGGAGRQPPRRADAGAAQPRHGEGARPARLLPLRQRVRRGRRA